VSQRRKAKAYNTYIALQAAYRSCSGAVHVTDRAGVQPIGRRLSAPTDRPTTNQPYAALVCRLMVPTPVIHLITWITTHIPTPEGWKAESA